MKTSDYFYIGYACTFLIFIGSVFIPEQQLGWLGMIGIIVSWVPITIGIIYFEEKETRKEHYEKCKCTCGNCCKRPKKESVS